MHVRGVFVNPQQSRTRQARVGARQKRSDPRRRGAHAVRFSRLRDSD
jgi:hypothetical protein